MCDISKCLFSQSYHLCVCWLASFTWLRWSIFWPQVSVCWERRSQLGHQLQASLIHKDSGHWSDSLTCKICGDHGLLLGMCISDMSYLSGEILTGLKSSLTTPLMQIHFGINMIFLLISFRVVLVTFFNCGTKRKKKQFELTSTLLYNFSIPWKELLQLYCGFYFSITVSTNLYNSKINYMFELFLLPLGFDAMLNKVTLIVLKLCIVTWILCCPASPQSISLYGATPIAKWNVTQLAVCKSQTSVFHLVSAKRSILFKCLFCHDLLYCLTVAVVGIVSGKTKEFLF